MATTNSLNVLMENPLIIGLISLAVTVYGPRLSPKLPSFISNAFNSSFFRFAVLLLIIFIGSRDVRVSMVLAILFMILLSIVNHQNIKEDFEQQINEYYVNYNLFQSREHMNGQPIEDDEENNRMVEYFDESAPLKENEDVIEYLEPNQSEKEVIQMKDINTSFMKDNALNNINRIAQDENFNLSPQCKTFFSDLEKTSQKCFQEFEEKAKQQSNQSSNVLAENARNAAISAKN